MSPLKTKIYLLFTIITLTTYFYSCKKEPGSDTLNSEIRQKLRDWYNMNASESKQNPFNTLTPNWDKVQIKEVKGQIVYEVSMNNPQKVFIGYENTDKKKAEEILSRSDTRFLIFENKQKGSLENGCYMSINNSGTENNVKSVGYKETSGFTGNIIFFNPNGKMANGWTYRDGATLQRISVSNETEYKSMMRISSEEERLNKKNGGKLAYRPAAYCTPEYRIIYGTSCAGVDGYMNCQQYVIGREYINNCEYGGGGGADGEYTPPTPTGGGTSSGSAPRELKTDSLKKKFPCAEKLILQPIFALKEMTEFVSPFQTEMKPTITYQTAKLDWNNNTVYQLGTTQHDPTSGLNQSTIITLNEEMLKNSSQLLIATTAVHETLHSYIYYNVATSIADQKDGVYKNANWLVSLNGFYLIKDLPSNYSNHSLMLNSYFDKAVNVLRKWADQQPTKYTDKELGMAMMYGLDAVDSKTPQASVDAINKLFDAKKKEIGGTASQLKSFYRGQLNSSTKLPTSGCN